MKKFSEWLESKQVGEYYAELDEDSDMWCVFHTDKNSGKAYSSWASKSEAEKDAARRNKMQEEMNQ